MDHANGGSNRPSGGRNIWVLSFDTFASAWERWLQWLPSSAVKTIRLRPPPPRAAAQAVAMPAEAAAIAAEAAAMAGKAAAELVEAAAELVEAAVEPEEAGA